MRIAILAGVLALAACAQDSGPQTWRVAEDVTRTRDGQDVAASALSLTGSEIGLFALSITCFADEADMLILVFPTGVGAADDFQQIPADQVTVTIGALVLDQFGQHVQGAEIRTTTDPFMRSLADERLLSIDGGYGVQNWPVATANDLAAVEQFAAACRRRS